MDITLEYCSLWNYEPQAVSLAARLLPRFKQQIGRLTLIPSTGGCFELTMGTTLVYSKLKTGQFPDEATLIEEVGRLLPR